MPDLSVIASAIDFVEDNLREAISVADMADAVSYSLYHFCRTFNRATHHTPYDYLMRRRLSEAVQELLGTGQRILDIALEYRFNNHETFSRAFKRMFDETPSQVRKQGHVEWWRPLPRLTLAHLQQIERGSGLKPALIEKEALQVAGLMTLVREDRSVVEELWQRLAHELQRCGQSLQGANCLGLAYYPPVHGDASSLYMAAIESSGLDCPALVFKHIPALRVARFIHRGPIADLPPTWDYVFHTWLPASGERLSQPFMIEGYGQAGRDGSQTGSQTAICVPIQ
jgi:AraC family transcriptional regulator